MRVFRLFRVAFLFGLFGAICLFGNLIFVPIVLLGLAKFSCINTFSRNLVRISWRWFLFWTWILGYQSSNAKSILKHIDLKNGSKIIICNHPSLLDVVFFLAYLKNVNCIVKGELAKNIFLSHAIRASNYILNNEAMLLNAIDALKNGENLVIFPEGSRTKETITFHKAASYIAINASSELNVVFLKMNTRSLRKNEPWYSISDKRLQYRFHLGECFRILDFEPQKSNALRVRILHSHLQQIYEREFRYDR